MLVMCGCVGQSGGGWSHYVGQEKLRPQSGWLPLAFALDWSRPPRQQNSTSFFYAHTDQWRYETLDVGEIVSPTAPAGPWDGALIDYNVRAERMGWLPSAPQLETNPLELSKKIAASGKEAKDYVAGALKSGELKLSCHDPDNPKNWPRNMFVWRSNLLGSSGKGHEYFLKHLLGTSHGVHGQAAGRDGRAEADRRRLARRGAGRKARPARHPRLPHVDHLRLLRHRAPHRHLVREERPQHLRHAPLHPSADRRGGPRVGGAQRLGDLQGDRQEVLRGRARGAGRREGRGADAHHARHAGRDRAGARRQGLEARRMRAGRRQDHAGGHGGRARLPQPLQALHVARAAHVEARQRRQGHGLEHRARGRFPQAPERRRHRRGADQGPAEDRERHRRRRGDPRRWRPRPTARWR